MVALKYSSYKLNGIDFHTQSYDEGHPVQGSGVALIAQTTSFQKGNCDNTSVRNKAYYGIIKEILELNYQHEGKVVLLKCDWVDNRVEDKWVKTGQFGITSVNFKHLFNTGEKMSDEPFILASQATQVYYVEDPIDAEWSTVVIPSYYDINEAENIDPGKMASRRGKSKDVMVTDEQLAEVEYELARNRMVEENEERMALLDLKKTKFDPELTDEELMPKRDDRISEADWKDLLKYWRSPEFEARSSKAKENRAKSTVPHTADSKSHGRVTQEMADELGYAPRRDEVYIRTHTLKKGPQKGQHVPHAAPVINKLLQGVDEHPDWREKSLKEGDLFARVVGMKEPRGRIHVLGLGPTPQDVGTPDTRGKEQMLASQGGHNLETPSSQHGSNSRQNSRIELGEDNDGEDDEEDGEDDYVQRRGVANPKGSLTHQDESLIGMDVLLYSWTGPESPVAKATVLSVDPDALVGGEPLGPTTYDVIVNVAIKRDATLPYQYDDLRYIGDAVTRSIAWPSSKMKLYKPAASGSSRR
ncbi:hypothetical protein ACQ4PT_021577 [Festuca glaucescens]